MRIEPNEGCSRLGNDYLFSEVSRRVESYLAESPSHNLLKLGIGDVTLPLCDSVCRAAENAAHEMGTVCGQRGYAPSEGYGFLRCAVAEKYSSLGVNISQEEIFISDGAKSDLAALSELFGNAAVVLTEPSYPVYAEVNLWAGRQIKYVRADSENGYLPLPDMLDRDGYIIYLCSPANPTGAAYDQSGLSAWVGFALETGSIIIYDAAYESFISDDSPHSVYEIEEAEMCAVEVQSLSKCAGFTGMRCGWTIVPSALICGGVSLRSVWKRWRDATYNGTPYIIQRAAEAALSDTGRAECMSQVRYYLENARIISEALSRCGISHVGGTSSPYVWAECPDGYGSWEFFDLLLHEYGIVSTPGAGFGECGEGYMRFSGLGSRETALAAAERLKRFAEDGSRHIL